MCDCGEECSNGESELDRFYRQLKYTDINTLYSHLTDNQKVELALLLNNDDTIMGINGGILKIEP